MLEINLFKGNQFILWILTQQMTACQRLVVILSKEFQKLKLKINDVPIIVSSVMEVF